MTKLLALRRERKMTQAELAERIGVSQGVISDYEHGRKMPRIPSLLKLCAVFDISMDELLSDESAKAV